MNKRKTALDEVEFGAAPVRGLVDGAPTRPISAAVVIGIGGIGLNVLQGLAISACGAILAVDANPAKEAAAKAFGGTHSIAAGPDVDTAAAVKEICPLGVDFAFECVGHPALIRQCIELLDWGGSCVLLGVPKFGSEASFVVNSLYNDKSILGCRYGAARPHHDIPLFIDLYKAACAGDFPEPAKKGTLHPEVNVLDAYTDAVLANTGVKDFGNLKLVIDCANGMGGYILPMLCKKVGNDPVRLYWRLDGRFPNHEANPLKTETLLALQDRVVDEQADLGVAFDGDGDRVAFTDEKGQIIPGDFVTALIAREMLKKRPGAEILYDLRSSWVVPEEIKKAGGKAIECRVGHGLIKKQMREEGGYFAGELSSHYYFSDFYTTDNGDLAMLNIIKLLLAEGKKMSEIVAPLRRYFHSGEINSEVKDIPAVLARLERKYGPAAKRVTEIDGYKAEFDDWWFNVRPSNTEPLIRLNLEAKTKEKMEEKVEELLTEIRS